MDDIIVGLSEQDLLTELERVERALARSTTFGRWVDAAGRNQLRVSPDPLALADREHAVLQELRQRRRALSPAVDAAALPLPALSWLPQQAICRTTGTAAAAGGSAAISAARERDRAR